MKVGVDPGHRDRRHERVSQRSDRGQAESPLDKGRCLDQHVGMGQQKLLVATKARKDPLCGRVTRIALVEQRVERGAVDEDRYEP